MSPEWILLLVAVAALWEVWQYTKRQRTLGQRLAYYIQSGKKNRRSVWDAPVLWKKLGVFLPVWLKSKDDLRLCLLLAGVTGMVSWFLLEAAWFSLLLGVVVAMITIRTLYIRKKAAMKKQFLDNFPDAVEGLTRAVNAGVALETGLVEMAQNFPEPVAGHFREIEMQLRLGIPFKKILHTLSAEIDVPEFEFFCTVLIINREAGAPVSDVMVRLSTSLREINDAARQLKILAAEPRSAANIVAVIPIALIGIQYLTNPAGVYFLVNDPTGKMFLAYAIVSIAAGLLLIRRMTRLG